MCVLIKVSKQIMVTYLESGDKLVFSMETQQQDMFKMWHEGFISAPERFSVCQTPR